jgi:hypothetical protein
MDGLFRNQGTKLIQLRDELTNQRAGDKEMSYNIRNLDKALNHLKRWMDQSASSRQSERR